jgi:hypothetical protein
MATTTRNTTTTLPKIGDVVDGDKLADDILRASAASDVNTQKIVRGGASAKYQPRAWSYGGSID